MVFLSFKTPGKWVIYHSAVCVCVCARVRVRSHIHACMCVFNRDFGEHRATVGIQLVILGRGSLLNQVDQPKVQLYLTRETRIGWWPSCSYIEKNEYPKGTKKETERENFKS